MSTRCADETIQALYGSGWTCNTSAITAPQAEPADNCYRGDVLAGENGEDPPITVVVSVANNAPASSTQSVVVSGGGSQGGSSSVTAATTIEQAADLTAASSHSGDFAQGGTGSYTLTVSNTDGPNSSSGGPAYGLVSVTDSLPWGLSATSMSGAGWTCVVSAATCYRSDALAAGQSYPPITLAVSVANDAPASVTNSVTVSGGGMTSGANSSTSAGGQTGADPTTITQTGPAGSPPAPPAAPSLTVTSTHSGSFAQGESGSYELQVRDAATAGPATGMVIVTGTLPAGLTPPTMSGNGWTCSLAPAIAVVTSSSRRSSVPTTYAPEPTCFPFSTLAAGASYPPITLDVAVDDNAQPSVTSQVTVTGGGAQAPDTTTVAQLPQLAVSSYDTAGGCRTCPSRAMAAATCTTSRWPTTVSPGVRRSGQLGRTRAPRPARMTRGPWRGVLCCGADLRQPHWGAQPPRSPGVRSSSAPAPFLRRRRAVILPSRRSPAGREPRHRRR